MQRLKGMLDGKLTEIHHIIACYLQDKFGRFKIDQTTINLVKLKKQKSNKETKK